MADKIKERIPTFLIMEDISNIKSEGFESYLMNDNINKIINDIIKLINPIK